MAEYPKRGAEDEDLLEVAWGIIANAHGGDWEKATPEWVDAAQRWRDKWLFARKKARFTKQVVSGERKS